MTIVDLSCPCVSPETACSLFNICLSLFLEQSISCGRVVALDEAHKVSIRFIDRLGTTKLTLLVHDWLSRVRGAYKHTFVDRAASKTPRSAYIRVYPRTDDSSSFLGSLHRDLDPSVLFPRLAACAWSSYCSHATTRSCLGRSARRFIRKLERNGKTPF